MFGAMSSPDRSADGLIAQSVDPLRYDGQPDDEHEAAGLMRALMPSGVRVLDVGCGTGSIMTIVNRGKGNTVIGIEPDAQRAAVAASRGFQVHRGYFDEPFREQCGNFDVIVFADVLEHLAEPASMLQDAKQVLAPNGRILFSVPNVAHWTVRAKLMSGKWEYTSSGLLDATHLRWFTQSSLRGLFDQCGYDIVEMGASVNFDTYERRLGWAKRGLGRWLITATVGTVPGLFGYQFVGAAQPREFRKEIVSRGAQAVY